MDTADQAAIRRQRELWKEAVEACDVDAVMSFYVEGAEYRGFDVMPPFTYDGSDAFRANWERFFDQFEGAPRFEFKDMEIYCSGDVAFVRGLTRFQGTMGGKAIDLWTRETNGLRKIDGVWLLVHDHISVPVDLATGQGCMDEKR